MGNVCVPLLRFPPCLVTDCYPLDRASTAVTTLTAYTLQSDGRSVIADKLNKFGQAVVFAKGYR